MFEKILDKVMGERKAHKFINEDFNSKFAAENSVNANSISSGRQLNSTQAPAAPLVTAQALQSRMSLQEHMDYLFYEFLFGASSSSQSMNPLEHLVAQKVDLLLEKPGAVLRAFPSLPATINKLVDSLSNDDFSLAGFSQLVSEEPVVASEIIKLANSPAFKRGDAEVCDLNKAFMFIGAQGIKTHVLDQFVGQLASVNPVYFRRFGEKIWRHSQETAAIASSLADAHGLRAEKDIAYFLGLIHDLGKIVVFQLLVESFQHVSPEYQPNSTLFKQVMTDKSMRISALLTKVWEMPELITRALLDMNREGGAKTPLGKVLYEANLVSELSILLQENKVDPEELESKLGFLGLSTSAKDIVISKLPASDFV